MAAFDGDVAAQVSLLGQFRDAVASCQREIPSDCQILGETGKRTLGASTELPQRIRERSRCRVFGQLFFPGLALGTRSSDEKVTGD
jgi:hypothetical protein